MFIKCVDRKQQKLHKRKASRLSQICDEPRKFSLNAVDNCSTFNIDVHNKAAKVFPAFE